MKPARQRVLTHCARKRASLRREAAKYKDGKGRERALASLARAKEN